MPEAPSRLQTFDLVEQLPRAIVVHCSDPRFQRAFGEFIHEQLHLADGEYIPLVISGGVVSLSEPLRLPKEFKFMKERIELFLDRFTTINRIILMNHEDCRHYAAVKENIGRIFPHRFSDMSERQRTDLKNVARTLLDLSVPGMSCELYYAAIVEGTPRRIAFERIL